MKKKLFIIPILLGALCLPAILPIHAETEEQPLTISADDIGNDQQDIKHTFIVKALDGSPMPEQSTLTTVGSEKAQLNFDNIQSQGIFHYEITEMPIDGCTCTDDYFVNVKVFYLFDIEKYSAVYYMGETDTKVDTLTFRNTWTPVFEPSEKKESESGSSKNTGIGIGYAPYIGLVAGVSLLCVFAVKRKSGEYDA